VHIFDNGWVVPTQWSLRVPCNLTTYREFWQLEGFCPTVSDFGGHLSGRALVQGAYARGLCPFPISVTKLTSAHACERCTKSIIRLYCILRAPFVVTLIVGDPLGVQWGPQQCPNIFSNHFRLFGWALLKFVLFYAIEYPLLSVKT